MSLEKACVKVLNGCTAGGISFNKDEKIFVQFNPEKYSIQANIQYSFTAKDGRLYGQYSGENARTLSVDLFFDMLSKQALYKRGALAPLDALGIEEQMDRAEAASSAHINRLIALTKPTKETSAPPMVEFLWGGESLKGVISSASVDYLLFNAKGEPTRAALQLTFSECDDVMKGGKNEKARLSLSGKDMSESVSDGDREIEELELKETIIKALKLL